MHSTEQYDIINVGTGADGGTLARKLAPSGQRILILERGDYVPREKANWEPKLVNLDGKYHTKETCLINAKADAQTCGIDPALAYPNVTLLTNAMVERLDTSPSGREVTKVVVCRDRKREEYSANVVVLSCGAINSAAFVMIELRFISLSGSSHFAEKRQLSDRVQVLFVILTVVDLFCSYIKGIKS